MNEQVENQQEVGSILNTAIGSDKSLLMETPRGFSLISQNDTESENVQNLMIQPLYSL